ncbi:restriction endonuclease [Paraburkholderia sediminicola]|uniref:restriction endonuclease n=1 Tax=Paraburkholderia sediminicola TaxID=458836 RepID=UPI0038B733CF
MSAFQYFELPPPRSWEQFEELCADLFEAAWNDPALVRHGRAGQRQSGVDIVGRQGSRYPVGLQCKKKARWPVQQLTIREIDQEINEAKAFTPALQTFYLLTTAIDDERLQQHIRSINERHKESGHFDVVLLGWSEIARRVHTISVSGSSRCKSLTCAYESSPWLNGTKTRGRFPPSPPDKVLCTISGR